MAVERTIDLSAKQRETILALLQRHLPGTTAWVYGSRAKWTSRPHSDLDLVVFATPEQQRAVSDLQEAFEESNLPFRVDLFVWNEVPDSFRKQIKRDHVVLVPPDTNKVPPQPEEPAKDTAPQRTPNSLSPGGKRSGRGANSRPAAPDFSKHAQPPQPTVPEKPHERDHVALVPHGASKVDPAPQSEHEKWPRMSFAEAVVVNPAVRLERGMTYPFVDMSAVTAGTRCVHAVEQRAYSGGGSRFQGGDTLMARITPCLENGKIARYCTDQPSVAAHGSTEFIVIRGRSGVTDSEYAYYLTRWDELRSYAVDQMTGTSGRQRVPVDSLGYLKVPIPPLPEQRAIAHILGTLDDKIELNRRMNQTLEAMARALFKSWFVDFDPVRAKMTLNQQAALHHHSPPQEEHANHSLPQKEARYHHSPLEGESASGGHQPAGAPVGGSSPAVHAIAQTSAGGSAAHVPASARAAGSAAHPPPHQPSPDGSASATPPQGGSDSNAPASEDQSDWTATAAQWQQIKRQYSQQTRQQARTLRKTQTNAEGLLWHYLRNKQLGGHKFRRQQPIGSYIVDMACMKQKLLIELDGGQHSEQRSYDEKRDAFLRSKGYNILRFWNNEVFENCLGVLQRIHAALHHHSLPQKEHANHSPLEGESASGGCQPAGAPVGGSSPAVHAIAQTSAGGSAAHVPASARAAGSAAHPPPHQPSPDGSASATPPQGGSDSNAPASEDQHDWTPERARTYLDGMDPEIIDRFPDALDDDGKPVGWTNRRIEDFLQLAYGKSLPSKKRIPGKVAVYGSGGLAGTHDTSLMEGPAVIVGRKGTVGSLYWEDGPVFPIDTVFYVVPRIGSLLFNYHLLATQPLQDMNTDAAVPGLNRGNVYRLEFPEPTLDLVFLFEELAGAFWQQRRKNLEENETLTQIRDTLLPKLMSGGIRLHNAEKIMEELV